MKKLMILTVMLLASIIPAQETELREIAGTTYLVETGYLGSTKVTLWHTVPEGGTVDNFQSELTDTPTYTEKVERKDSKIVYALEDPIEESVTPMMYISDSEVKIGLVYTAKFNNFSELGQRLAWRVRLTDEPYLVAQNGEGDPANLPIPDSFWNKLAEAIADNPVKSTVLALAGVVGWDYIENGEVDAFGVAASSSNEPGEPAPPESTDARSGRTVVEANGGGIRVDTSENKNIEVRRNADGSVSTLVTTPFESPSAE